MPAFHKRGAIEAAVGSYTLCSAYSGFNGGFAPGKLRCTLGALFLVTCRVRWMTGEYRVMFGIVSFDSR